MVTFQRVVVGVGGASTTALSYCSERLLITFAVRLCRATTRICGIRVNRNRSRAVRHGPSARDLQRQRTSPYSERVVAFIPGFPAGRAACCASGRPFLHLSSRSAQARRRVPRIIIVFLWRADSIRASQIIPASVRAVSRIVGIGSARIAFSVDSSVFTMEFGWGSAITILLLIGLLIAAARFVSAWRGPARAPTVNVHSTIEGMRTIGELAVYRVFTKEIVTQSDHSWGDFGERYLSWLLTRKKMVMIFEFEIEFRFDLRDPRFRIEDLGAGAFRMHMPPASHDVRILDISVYDEQKARVLPWLLPDLLNGFVAGAFNEQDKNRLISAARHHAEQRAAEQIRKLQADLRASAESTLRSVARGFGANDVSFAFDAETKPAIVVDIAERLAA